jgi:hypothetical protein
MQTHTGIAVRLLDINFLNYKVHISFTPANVRNEAKHVPYGVKIHMNTHSVTAIGHSST